MKKISYVFILLAGILWGCIGLFVRTLNAKDLGSMDIVFLRAIVTAVAMTLYLLLFNRKLLIIKLKDIWCFLGTGIASIAFFNFCYFKCITASSLSVASVLLYTAPAIVMVLSYFLFHERFTVRKAVSLVMTFAGCVCVTGALDGLDNVSPKGLLYGFGAGLGYALYSIFSRYAIDKGYHSLTITCYTFIITSIATVFFTDTGRIIGVVSESWSLVWLILALGVVCTVVPYLLYTLGLVHVENSKASIVASIEPVTATLIGAVVFHEKLSMEGVLGVVLVIAALVICNSASGERRLADDAE